MNCLINASFSINVLFDGSTDEEVVKILFRGFAAWSPGFGWDDSDHSVVIFVLFFSQSHKLEEVTELFIIGFQKGALVYFILSSKQKNKCERKSTCRLGRTERNGLP